MSGPRLWNIRRGFATRTIPTLSVHICQQNRTPPTAHEQFYLGAADSHETGSQWEFPTRHGRWGSLGLYRAPSFSPGTGQRGLISHTTHMSAHPLPRRPPFRVPAHSPTLPTRPAAKADIPHPCRSDQNLLFFPALLDSSGTYVKKAKNA